MSTADIIRRAALRAWPIEGRIFSAWVSAPNARNALFEHLHEEIWYEPASLDVRRMALLFVAEAVESEA